MKYLILANGTWTKKTACIFSYWTDSKGEIVVPGICWNGPEEYNWLGHFSWIMEKTSEIQSQRFCPKWTVQEREAKKICLPI